MGQAKEEEISSLRARARYSRHQRGLKRLNQGRLKTLQSSPSLVGRRFELVSSAAQLEEIVRVSRYSQVRHFIESVEVGWLVNRIRDRALLVERLPDVDASADLGDNFLLAMAEAADSDYLVTGDKAGLLAIKKHGRTQVVTVSSMLATLKIR